MDIVTEITRLGGVAPTGRLNRIGFTQSAIARAVDAGRIRKLRRGYYAAPEAPADLISAAMLGARLTCLSAAPFLGIEVLRQPSRPHVALDSGRPAGSAVSHRSASRPCPANVMVVRPVDCVVHALRCLPELDALVLAESAIARGRVAPADLPARLTGPVNGPPRRILGLVDPRAGSVLETVARRGFLAAGFDVRTQVRVHRVLDETARV